jgi:hypothetical protein
MINVLTNSLQIIQYSESDNDVWDEFVSRSPNATFLHSRRFLSYHGQRFRDLSLLLKGREGKIVGVFPAAIDPRDEFRVISHPGITFGGLVHTGDLYGEKMIESLEVICDHYAREGFQSLRYKAVPYIYHQVPAGDDLYALFRLGARRSRCDLSCAIDLSRRRVPSSRRKRSVKKAIKHGVQLAEGVDFAEDLWRVVTDNLAQKHSASPVHTAVEIQYLYNLFPKNVRFVVALLNQEIVAGVTLFVTPILTHAQYIAASLSGYEVSALDAIFEHSIEQAQAEGCRYFDFGTSNRNDGQLLNESLYRFKTEFGGGGVAHEFYDLDLSSQRPADNK